MPSRPKSVRKSSTDAESASKASNGEAVMNIPPAADSGSVGPTANMIGAETNQENAKSSSPESIIPVEAGTPAKEEIAGSNQNQGLGPTPAESSQQTRQTQPSFSGYRQSQGLEHAEPYPPKRNDRSAASAPATPFNYNTLYSSYVPQPSANPNESVGASMSAPPFSYPAADTSQTQTQPSYFPRQSGPVPAPASAPAGYFTPYQDYQPAQTYAPRSYPYTGHLYPAYGSQQAPHAGQARDELHRGRGATSQRQTGQSAAPFPPNAPPVIPPVAPYYAPYAQHPSRKTDAFVANDPWRPHVHKKHQKEAETFDDIPLPPTSQPPWMPHGPRHRMASPQVPQPVIPPVYQPAIPGAHMYPQPIIPPVRPPPSEYSDSEPFINPSPIVLPEPASTNSSPPHRQGSLSSERSSASGSPRPAITIPSPRRSSIHSSPHWLEDSVGSSGHWETSSPVADPVARPGHNDDETTKFSRTSWSTEIISRPSDDLTTPLPPTMSSFRRAANRLKRPFKATFHKPGNLSPQSSYASPSTTSSIYQVPLYYTNFPGPPPFSQTSYQVFSEAAFFVLFESGPNIRRGGPDPAGTQEDGSRNGLAGEGSS
ncbi:hypothetical protein CPC08DRAFT_220011 [Agrocybe pediades]|nr:hypothetical protein CPC08DRAFT_220011 [Agrocybe pediades]